MSDDLVDFLQACVDEDERVARNAGASTYGLINHRAHRPGWSDLAEVHPTRRLAEFEDKDEASFQHIARHDPARVLAEVAAKRRIIERHAIVHRDIGWLDDDGDEEYAELPVCGHCVPRHSHFRSREEVPVGLCADVRDLASVYAGRPGWRSEWTPDEEVTS